MLNNINSNDGIVNSLIRQQDEINEIDKKSVSKNPYKKNTELVDESLISQEALKLYEKDREIAKYKSMVLSSLTSGDGSKEVANLLQNGKYEVSDDDLADSMLSDSDLLNMLFG
jgi:hypothetical protein